MFLLQRRANVCDWVETQKFNYTNAGAGRIITADPATGKMKKHGKQNKITIKTMR